MTTPSTATIVTAYAAPDGTKYAAVRYEGSTYQVRQSPKLFTTVHRNLGGTRVTKRDDSRIFHAVVEAAFAEWEAPAETAPEWKLLGYATEEAYRAAAAEVTARRVAEVEAIADAAEPEWATEEPAPAAAPAGELTGELRTDPVTGGVRYWTREELDAEAATPAYVELPATAEVPCCECGGDTIPPQAAHGEEGRYCEGCGAVTPEPAAQPERRTLGQMSPAERAATVSRATARFQAELTAAAPAFAAVLAEPLPGEEPAPHLHEGDSYGPCGRCGRDRASYLHSTLPPVQVPPGYTMRPAELPLSMRPPVTNPDLWR